MRLDDENASFRFNQSGLKKFLGDLECDIMELVWKKANPTITVRQIHDILRQQREIAYTTVMTTMARLAEKGLLKIIGQDRLAHCYVPDKTREDFVRDAVARVLAKFMREFPEESQAALAKIKSKSKKR